jgi:membrane protein DedA with SNARE-associated domain
VKVHTSVAETAWPDHTSERKQKGMTNPDGFLSWLTTLPHWLVYLLLGLSAFVENVFPPIPGDTITAFGAFLVGTGSLNFMGVYLATTIGSVSGFLFLFWLGLLLGRRFFVERDYRFFKASDILRAEDWFRKYGYWLILLNRFLPGVRSVISIAGGISKLRIIAAALLATASSAAWNLIWILAGYFLGTNWAVVKESLARLLFRYNMAILGIGVLVVLVVLVRRGLRHKQRSRDR